MVHPVDTDPSLSDRGILDRGFLDRGHEALRRRRVGEALRCFEEAERCGLPPDECSGGRWHCWMLLGEYEKAWRESDAIRRRKNQDPHRYWDGSSLKDRRLMVRCLHGFGDTIQNARFLPLLQRETRKLIVEVSPPLEGIMKCLPAIDQLRTWEDAGHNNRSDWDTQIEITELPFIFRTTINTLPPPAPFQIPSEQIETASRTLGSGNRPRVGLVWSGGDWDKTRSIPFAELTPLLQPGEVEFWSLQAKQENSEWRAYAGECGWPSQRVCGEDSVVTLAAAICNMDLVLTVDTLAAHLAGTLRRQVWTMLKHDADWRWMLKRSDSPWYPGMRLFRQTRPGDWAGVVSMVKDKLTQWRRSR